MNSFGVVDETGFEPAASSVCYGLSFCSGGVFGCFIFLSSLLSGSYDYECYAKHHYCCCIV